LKGQNESNVTEATKNKCPETAYSEGYALICMCVCVCVCTWAEADVRDGVAAMVEALEILQRVGVHHQHATVAQTDGQRLSVRGEGAAATAWKTHTHTHTKSVRHLINHRSNYISPRLGSPPLLFLFLTLFCLLCNEDKMCKVS